MIKNLLNVPYNKNGKVGKCQWWTWDEFCDDCGALFREGGTFKSSSRPEKEKSYCLKCLYLRLDAEIPPLR